MSRAQTDPAINSVVTAVASDFLIVISGCFYSVADQSSCLIQCLLKFYSDV
jgi:hypothetical protein